MVVVVVEWRRGGGGGGGAYVCWFAPSFSCYHSCYQSWLAPLSLMLLIMAHARMRMVRFVRTRVRIFEFDRLLLWSDGLLLLSLSPIPYSNLRAYCHHFSCEIPAQIRELGGFCLCDGHDDETRRRHKPT